MRKLMAALTGLIVAASMVGVAGPVDAHPWGGHQRDTCAGEAPLLVTCSTGVHFRFADEPLLRHGFTDVAETYTGTTVSTLSYLGGARSFACDWQDGTLVAGSCRGSGDFPPPQTYFLQTCDSYELGTTTRGGSGGWSCYMEHG